MAINDPGERTADTTAPSPLGPALGPPAGSASAPTADSASGPVPGTAGAAVSAAALSLRGPRGWVYRDIAFEAAPGSLIAIEGPAGSGRTCLLLTLAGRMRPGSGAAEVGGHPLPRRMAAVRRIAALGPVRGVNDLDPALAIGEHTHERVLLQQRFVEGLVTALLPGRGRRRAEEADRTASALALAGLDLAALPNGPGTAVRDLGALDTFRLGLALALLARPRLVCLDDVGLGLPTAETASAWRTLRAVADRGVTVLATCAEAPVETRAPTGTRTCADDDAPAGVRAPGTVIVRLRPDSGAPAPAGTRTPRAQDHDQGRSQGRDHKKEREKQDARAGTRRP